MVAAYTSEGACMFAVGVVDGVNLNPMSRMVAANGDFIPAQGGPSNFPCGADAVPSVVAVEQLCDVSRERLGEVLRGRDRGRVVSCTFRRECPYQAHVVLASLSGEALFVDATRFVGAPKQPKTS